MLKNATISTDAFVKKNVKIYNNTFSDRLARTSLSF